MAIGAHADDIEEYVGGTLLKYRDHGYQVVYVMATNNMAGAWCEWKPDGTLMKKKPPYDVMLPQRKREAAAGARAFGTTPVHLDHPNRHYYGKEGVLKCVCYGSDRPACVAPNTPTILTAHEDPMAQQRVVDLILEHNPEAILTHGMDQNDMEHLGTALLTAKSYWQAVAKGYGGMLLQWRSGFTYLGELNCRWDTFVDITRYWDKKVAAIALHASQVPDPDRLGADYPPFQRSQAWGTACGCGLAEVFTIVSRPRGRPKRPALYLDFTWEIIDHAR